MKGINSLLLNQIMCLAVSGKSPMAILGQKADSPLGNARDWNGVSKDLGIPDLWTIIIGGGIALAIIVIMVHLIKLLIVNYPKTVMQTKTKVVQAFFVIVALSSLAFLFDIVLKVTQNSLGMTIGTG